MNRRELLFFRWKQHNKIIGALSILLVMILGGSIVRIAGQTDARTTLSTNVNATGLLQAAVYNLTFPNASGNISEIDVTQGQRVTKGEVLARLDAKTLQDAVNLAQVAVDTARHTLDSTQNFANKVDTFHQDVVDAAQTALSVSQANEKAVLHQSRVSIEAAEEILEADQHTLTEARKFLQDEIRAAKLELKQNLAACTPQPTPLPQPAPAPQPQPPPIPQPAPQPPPPIPQPPLLTHQSVSSGLNPSVNGPMPPSEQLCRQVAQAEFERDVQAARVAVASAQADVVTDEQNLRVAKATARVNNTNARGQVEIAESLLEVAEDTPDEASALTQVVFAQGQLEIAIAQLNIAQSDLSNATLIAPHDGVVTAINGAVGATPGLRTNIADGFSSAESGTFIQITDTSSVRQLIARVDEADILRVKVGQQAQFTLKAYGNRIFSGTVAAISPNGIFNGTSSVYPVIINVNQTSTNGATLVPNMSASVIITTS